MLWYKPLKLSASSRGTYVSCQRKFWHQYIAKTNKDDDYSDPEYFIFGRVFAECLEAFRHEATFMASDVVQSIASKHGLKPDSPAKLLACLRSYFAKFPSSNIRACEVWLENAVLRGKVDAISQEENGFYIIENKTASEISVTLPMELKSNPQICLYASEADSLKKTLNLADKTLLGVKYRVTSKPKERRKKNEDLLEYSLRCTSRTEEFFVPLASLELDQVLRSFQIVLDEIKAKKSDKELFACNNQECVKFHQPCSYYSQCHGALYSNAKLEDDSSVDF